MPLDLIRKQSKEKTPSEVATDSSTAATTSELGTVRQDTTRLAAYNFTLGQVSSSTNSLGPILVSHTVSASDAGKLKITLYGNMEGGKGEFSVYKNSASVFLLDNGVSYDNNSYSSIRVYVGDFVEGDTIELYFYRNSAGGTSTGYAGSGMIIETLPNYYTSE